MADLSTSYMGIKLKNPIILGASNLVSKPETISRIVDAGVGAIVYKSLFEEQIQLESLQYDEELKEYENRNAEMGRLFPGLEHAGPKEHLYNVSQLKKSVSVPVFASLNAIYESTWVEYARLLAETGIDGLEINLYATPGYFELSGNSIEEKQLQIVQSIRSVVKIPISVKLSPFYTNALNFIKRLDEIGIQGYVLFNKFFQPEVDVENELFHFPWELTHSQDHQLALRYAGLLHGNIDASICASRGVITSEDVIRLLLVGADAVQMVSAIYKFQPEYVGEVLKGVSDWMEQKGYKTISDFKGKLSRKNLKDPYAYQRAQYVDILMKSEEIFKKHPMP